jgi:hypothetical protein
LKRGRVVIIAGAATASKRKTVRQDE